MPSLVAQFLMEDLHVFRSPYFFSSYQIIPILVISGYLVNLVWFQQLLVRAYSKQER